MTKLYKILFMTSMMLGTITAISSQSWVGMWMGLEINLLSIIPLMSSQKNMLSSESTMKYFIVQAIASTLILFSVIVLMMKTNWQSSINNEMMSGMIMNSALLTKMGMAPFHFWFPEIMEGQPWNNCILIMTWQKIAPMTLMMYNMKFPMIIFMAIVLSMIISGIMGINQISLRKILSYSSINHMGWMMATMMNFKTIWILYFVIYSVISINIAMILKKFKIFFLKQMFQMLNFHPMIKMLFIINFLSLSGVPPFLGFVPKWFTIQTLVENGMIFTPTLMIIFTLVTIFMYIRITLTALLMNSNESNWSLQVKSNMKSTLIATFNFISIISMMFITIIFFYL